MKKGSDKQTEKVNVCAHTTAQDGFLKKKEYQVKHTRTPRKGPSKTNILELEIFQPQAGCASDKHQKKKKFNMMSGRLRFGNA